MAAREAYVRGCYARDEIECHVGVEMRPGDDVDDMMLGVKLVAGCALWTGGGNHVLGVETAEKCIKERWPGRAYFVETDEGGRGVQVYQPYGMPRTDGGSQ